MHSKVGVVLQLGFGLSLGITAAVIIYQLDRLHRLSLELQRSLMDVRLALRELQCRPSKLSLPLTLSGNRAGLQPSQSRRSSQSSSDMFYDLDSAESFATPTDLDALSASGDAPVYRGSMEWDESSPAAQQLFEHVDALMVEQPLDAVLALDSRKFELGTAAGWLWRKTKAHKLIGDTMESEQLQEDQLAKALECGELAVRLHEHSAFTHKWYAVAVGARSEKLSGSTRERVAGGQLFQQHVDAALQLDPSDHQLHHMRGRFHYEVAKSSWLERKAAAVLLSLPSDCTAEALQALLLAEQLNNDDWMENRLFIARCYVLMENYAEALCWLDKAALCPVLPAPAGDSVVAEVDALRLKCSSYIQ